MSKIVNTFTLCVLVTFGVGFFAYYQNGVDIEDVGESIALKILEVLPRKNKDGAALRDILDNDLNNNHTDAPAAPEPPAVVEEEAEPEAAVILSKASIYDNVGPYTPKRAMDKRMNGLRETCIKYSDFMRPEKVPIKKL